MVVRRRVEFQAAYLLHSYPWRETSLIAEIFSPDHGRVAMVAKGARRPLSNLRSVLMAFQPLSLTWSGKAEVKTLVEAEWVGGLPLLQGSALLCGYYLNELLLRLLPREDPHPRLFEAYAQSLAKLALGLPHAPLLREFELTLLRELGYAPTLDREADGQRPVIPSEYYFFLPERGPVPARGESADSALIPGHVLLAMAAGDFSQPATLSHAKALMRRLINHHLDGQELASRRILIELQEL
ncbi:DNA repair protein RecO [Uliginosibacterium gangwonense]|uniref:DNA repair protein RecO n=1 Tax=Uliginosibacterium gangwonense TaxID=392736 RepID=UPI00037B75C0|nr:DNA repair protein RecO [Uliginosibacterium gangwonense]